MKKQSLVQKGVAAIEFAILLPVLLAILLGIINYGLLMYNQAVITNAAREGARWAAIHNSAIVGGACANAYSPAPADACQAAYSYATNNLFSFGAPAITVTQSNSGTYLPGTPQTVIVRYTYTGIATVFVGNPDGNYQSTAVMLHE
jgi:Flp pilus assembly protein TadG